jgi:hypothetical protein
MVHSTAEVGRVGVLHFVVQVLALVQVRHLLDDFEPICLLGKYWELIREDWVDWVDEYRRDH